MSGTNSEEHPIDVSVVDKGSSTVEIEENKDNKDNEDNTDNKDNIKVEEGKNVEEEVVNALRVQLEYYFSFENLSKDTFLCSIMSSSRTEMEQRSGTQHGRHAPIVMLARFGKVKKIVNNFDTIIDLHQYLKLAALASDHLEVVPINGSQLLAIGPKSGSPLPYESDFQKADLPPAVEVEPLKHTDRNTIILREMPASTTQLQVQDIFSWESCPIVKSVHADVGYCWFVTFETTEDEVVSVLLKLRNMKFEGQPIKARLKPQSSIKPAYSPAPDATPFSSNSHNSDINAVDAPANNKNSLIKANNKSKSTTNNRNGVNGRNNTRYSASDRNNRNRSFTRPRSPVTNKANNKSTPTPPPQFHDSNFPSLLADNLSDKPVLTDTTEESKDNNSVITGYAAALLKTSNSRISKTPSPPPTLKKPSTSPKDTKQHTKATDRISKGKNIPTKLEDDGSNRTATTDEKSSISSAQSDKPIILINNNVIDSSSTPSSVSWSGKKSFADVLKKQQVEQN